MEKEKSKDKAAAETEASAPKVRKATESGKSHSDVKRALTAASKAIAISGSGEPQVKDIDSIRAEAFTRLYSAKNSGTILTGRICAAETAEARQSPEEACLGVVDYGGVKVIIPAGKLWDIMPDFPMGATAADQRRRYLNAVSAMLGAEIDFIVLEIDEKSNLAVGSRTDAMAIRRKQNYIRKYRGGAESRMEIAARLGSKVEARVTAVAGSLLRVEIFGADAIVRARDACWRYTADLSSVFHAGDHVYVVIKDLKIDRKTGRAELSASIREATENVLLHNIKFYREESIQLGVISGKTNKGYFVAVGNADTGIDVFCSRVMGQVMPQVGDTVACRINRIFDDGKANGKITRIIRSVQTVGF